MRVGDGELDFTISRLRGGVKVKVDKVPAGLRLELPA
jgi:hypothetical protein